MDLKKLKLWMFCIHILTEMLESNSDEDESSYIY